MPNFVSDPNAIGSGYSFVTAGTPTPLTDRLLDPVTRDYVRTANGEWAETPDSRTLVMVMLELELGASPFDPADGTTIGALRRNGDPVTPEEVEAEAQRVGDALVRNGVIADFQAATRDAAGNILRDSAGRMVVALAWRDPASGSPVDLVVRG